MQLGFWIYPLIILVKTTEVSLATVRIKLITKGQQLIGSIVGFFEIILWLIVVSAVLTDITSDPLKVISYAIGFAVGNYIGSIVEEKLGLGSVRVEIIVPDTIGAELAGILREHGHAVTMLEGGGKTQKRSILLTMAKRKETPRINHLVQSMCSDAFVSMTDLKPVYGGYGSIKK